jgi:uncharacterized protein
MRFPKSLTCAAIVAGAFALPAAAQQVTMMTGPQGGVWIPLGGALKNMWEQAVPGLQIQQTPGAGVANVRGVDEGKAQIGFANSSTTVDGLAGREPYKKKVTKVCQVANLYPQYFQVVALADAKVKSFSDLKGKTVITQPKGNTAEVVTSMVLQINGMNYQNPKVQFQGSYTDAVAMLKDGHAQVMTLGTTAPASAVMDLASARDVTLVPADDRTLAELNKQNPGFYKKIFIKAGTYPKQDKDVPVIGYSTHIIASCDLPEEVVYKMTKAMATNVDAMAAVVKPIAGLTPKDMAVDIGVPLHKGAAKFYKEVGAI